MAVFIKFVVLMVSHLPSSRREETILVNEKSSVFHLKNFDFYGCDLEFMIWSLKFVISISNQQSAMRYPKIPFCFS